MKLNIMSVKCTENFHAGQKAPSDIVKILSEKYESKLIFFEDKPVKMLHSKIHMRTRYFWSFIKSRISHDIVLLQFPMPENSKILNKLFIFNMKFLNKKKTIILIHDINGARYQDKELYKNEIARINQAKYIIAHNEIMKQKLVEDGVTSKIYTLELFDYLCDYDNTVKPSKFDLKNPIIVYAGNLSEKKSPFIHELDPKKMNFTLKLYGIGIEKNINKKIVYVDKFNPEELPNKLEGNLGLIWDGLANDSDSSIGMKNYTKINNPHKLSCYMAAGLPVIVWQQSAISHFVKKYNVGYIIDNIYDINKLDLSDLEEKINNVKKIQNKVRNGMYTKEVIDKILADMGEKLWNMII